MLMDFMNDWMDSNEGIDHKHDICDPLLSNHIHPYHGNMFTFVVDSKIVYNIWDINTQKSPYRPGFYEAVIMPSRSS